MSLEVSIRDCLSTTAGSTGITSLIPANSALAEDLCYCLEDGRIAGRV